MTPVEGIDTQLEGDPASIRALARWLRHRCGAGVDACATALKRAHDDAEDAWSDDAGVMYRAGLVGQGRSAAHLADDIGRVARAMETYASNLASALRLVERARTTAADAGLEVVGTVIYFPDEPVTAPASAPPDQAATWAKNINDARIGAYREASALVFQANDILVQTGLESLLDELWGQRYFHAADVVNGETEVLAAWYRGRLTKRSADLATRSGNLAKWADVMPDWDAPAIAREADNLAIEYADGSARAGKAAGGLGLVARLSRFGVGPGLTVFGIYVDIKTGSPPEKAIVKGIAGFAASAVVAAGIGGPPGWVALGAVIAGGVVGFLSGMIYDHVVPDRVKGRAEDYVRGRADAYNQEVEQQRHEIRAHEDYLRERTRDDYYSPSTGWDPRRSTSKEGSGE